MAQSHHSRSFSVTHTHTQTHMCADTRGSNASGQDVRMTALGLTSTCCARSEHFRTKANTHAPMLQTLVQRQQKNASRKQADACNANVLWPMTCFIAAHGGCCTCALPAPM